MNFKNCQLASKQHVVIVEQNYSNKCQIKVKRVFVNEYNLNIFIKTVSKIVSKWRANGIIHNLNKGHSGRLKHI